MIYNTAADMFFFPDQEQPLHPNVHRQLPIWFFNTTCTPEIETTASARGTMAAETLGENGFPVWSFMLACRGSAGRWGVIRDGAFNARCCVEENRARTKKKAGSVVCKHLFRKTHVQLSHLQVVVVPEYDCVLNNSLPQIQGTYNSIAFEKIYTNH
jgi:hypothetical protein